MSKDVANRFEIRKSPLFSEDDAAYGLAGALIGGSYGMITNLFDQAEHANLIEISPGGQKIPAIGTGELVTDSMLGAGAGFVTAALLACGVRKVADFVKRRRFINDQVAELDKLDRLEQFINQPRPH